MPAWRRGCERCALLSACPGTASNACRQWASYYRGLAEQARTEGNAGSAITYDSLTETYRVLGR